MKRSERGVSGEGAPFAENLRGALEKRKMTQSDLAARIGAGASSVSWWITGRSLPEAATCVRIADALDVSLDDLFGRAVPAGGQEKNRMRAVAVTLIEDTRDIYGDLQALNKHARMLERLARKYRLIEEEEE